MDPSMKPQGRSLQVNEFATSFKLKGSIRGRDMSLRSQHENENWSLDRKIEVATKLRVEEHKGGRNLKRSQTKSLQRN